MFYATDLSGFGSYYDPPFIGVVDYGELTQSSGNYALLTWSAIDYNPGDVVLVCAASQYYSLGSTPSGFSALNTDTGGDPVYGGVWVRKTDGTETGTVQFFTVPGLQVGAYIVIRGTQTPDTNDQNFAESNTNQITWVVSDVGGVGNEKTSGGVSVVFMMADSEFSTWTQSTGYVKAYRSIYTGSAVTILLQYLENASTDNVGGYDVINPSNMNGSSTRYRTVHVYCELPI